MPLSALQAGLIGSAANAGLDMSSGLMNTLIGINQSGVSYSRQKRLMDYQNQIYLRNLAEDRAYNTPAATMQRYKDAGLNPALIYGTGTDAAKSAMPSASAPPMANANFAANGLNIVHDVLSMYQGLAQIKYLNARANATTGRENREQELHSNLLESSKWNAVLSHYNADAKLLENKFFGESFNDRLNALKLDNSQKQAMIDDIGASIQTKLQQLKYNKFAMPRMLAKMDSELKSMALQRDKTSAEIKKISEEVELIKSNKSLTDAQRDDLVMTREDRLNKLKAEVNKLKKDALKVETERSILHRQDEWENTHNFLYSLNRSHDAMQGVGSVLRGFGGAFTGLSKFMPFNILAETLKKFLPF